MRIKDCYNRCYERVNKIPFFKKILDLPVCKKLFEYEVFSYLVFGVLTTVVNFLVFFIANKFVGSNYEKLVLFTVSSFRFKWLYIANMIAWICAVIFAFLTNKYFVFETDTGSPKAVLKEFALFVSARIVSFLLFEELLFGIIIAVFGKVSGISWIAKIVVAVIVVAFNYVASKLVIFKGKAEDEKDREK